MNYYQHHIGDYRRDTAHLSLLEHGIYRQLIDHYYLNELPITNDENKLMRLLCVRNADDMQHVRNVLNDFFLLTESGYIHKRCDIEIEKFHGKSKSASESAKARWSMKNKIIDANALQTQTECNANHKPITNNQDIKPFVLSDAKDSAPCPHQDIIDLYHEILPSCPRIRDWTPARQTHLRARWNEDKSRQSLDYWKRFFKFVADCDFLVGKSGNKPFFADLEWMVKSANFTKIREEKYANR